PVGGWQEQFRLQCSRLARFEELAANVLEHGKGQHVLIVQGQLPNLCAQTLHLGLESVGRSPVDYFRGTNGFGTQAGIHCCRRLSVTTLEVAFYLICDGAVTLTSQYVEYRLGSNNLRSRCHQGRE